MPRLQVECRRCGALFTSSPTGVTVNCPACRKAPKATRAKVYTAMPCARCGHVHTTLRCDRCGF